MTDQNRYPYTEPSTQQSPNYGQPPYGYPQQGPYGPQHPPMAPYQQHYSPYGYPLPVEHPQASMVQIMGILGIFTGITAFVAWYMGGEARKEIQAGAPYPWDGKLKTGYMLGKVFSILYIVGFALLIALYAALFIGVFLVMP